jgi:hypothetical protein
MPSMAYQTVKFNKNKKVTQFFQFSYEIALILEIGVWNFAVDVKMNQFVVILLLKLDLILSKHPSNDYYPLIIVQ